jgi:hypothetical protein
MYRSVYRSGGWLPLLLVLAGCRESGSEVDRTRMPDAAARTGSAELEDREAGVEFEAPRLIPAVRAQIGEIQDPEGATEGNIAAFRNGTGALVTAMEADLNRVGAVDAGEFRALADSVLREIGGGAGSTPDIPQEKARQAAAQVERLIRIYEERMRKVAN